MENDNNKLEKVKISEPLRKGVDYYLNNFELRNAICQIPEIGPGLDYMITSLGNKFQEQRLVESLTILYEEIDFLDKTKIDRKFLKEEEFFDLFIKAFDNCVRTRHRERIRLNCKILVGAISLDNIHERYSAEDFLSFVADLSPVDLMLGLKIYEQQKNRPKQFGFDSSKRDTELDFVVDRGWHKLQEACRLDDVDFRISLHKLSRAGLIKEIVGMYGNYVGGLYTITPTFQSLMNFIKLKVNDPLFNIRIRDPYEK